MTAVAVAPAPEPGTLERRALWAVARYESLRLVRHPVFFLAVLIYLYAAANEDVHGKTPTPLPRPPRKEPSRTSTGR